MDSPALRMKSKFLTMLTAWVVLLFISLIEQPWEVKERARTTALGLQATLGELSSMLYSLFIKISCTIQLFLEHLLFTLHPQPTIDISAYLLSTSHPKPLPQWFISLTASKPNWHFLLPSLFKQTLYKLDPENLVRNRHWIDIYKRTDEDLFHFVWKLLNICYKTCPLPTRKGGRPVRSKYCYSIVTMYLIEQILMCLGRRVRRTLVCLEHILGLSSVLSMK